MKRIILVLTVLLSFICEGITGQNKSSKPMKILVAYFSRSGNTRTIAEQIQKVTGADIFEIERKEAYPSSYQDLLDLAKMEINKEEKPPLKAMPKDLAQYDVIFVGSPNWWSTIAPPVATFLSNGNLSGKTVVTFVTHGGGGMAKCESAVRKLCRQTKILKGFAINGSSVQSAAAQVQKWLQGIGMAK